MNSERSVAAGLLFTSLCLNYSLILSYNGNMFPFSAMFFIVLINYNMVIENS